MMFDRFRQRFTGGWLRRGDRGLLASGGASAQVYAGLDSFTASDYWEDAANGLAGSNTITVGAVFRYDEAPSNSEALFVRDTSSLTRSYSIYVNASGEGVVNVKDGAGPKMATLALGATGKINTVLLRYNNASGLDIFVNGTKGTTTVSGGGYTSGTRKPTIGAFQGGVLPNATAGAILGAVYLNGTALSDANAAQWHTDCQSADNGVADFTTAATEIFRVSDISGSTWDGAVASTSLTRIGTGGTSVSVDSVWA